METLMMKLTEIKPFPNNTKKHDEKQINNVAESIKQFGFIQPVVIDKNNEIIIGHCRFLAAQQLGLQEIPCLRLEKLTDKQVKMLRIIDNKTNESSWDNDLLVSEIKDIDLSDFDFDFNFPEEMSQDDLDEFFMDSGTGKDTDKKGNKTKKIQCPHCGEWFEIKE